MSNDAVILQNKLNRSEARCRDMEEQLRIKKQQWEQAESTYKEAEFHCRRLCEEILVRDSSEIVLGKMYSWDSLSTAAMAMKALTSLRRYNAERTDMQRKLLDISEERRLKIDSLLEQIDVLRSCQESPREEPNISYGEPVSGEKAQEPTEIPHTPAPAYTAAPPVVEMIIEEDGDVVEADIQDMQEIEKMVQELKPVEREIPVHPAKRVVREQQKKRQEKSMAHMVNLSEYQEKMTGVMWRVLEIIGKEGISAYTDIEMRVQELMPDEITKASLRMSVRSLYSMGILAQEQISDPLRSKFMAYRLTEIGHRLFKERYKESPILSELDIIISQHDNANHGYGIKALWKILSDSGFFDTVSMDRKANTVKLRRGGLYIPDIMAIKDNTTMYIEYECGTHVQADFTAKCNKMLQVTNDVYIVTPNRDILQKRIMNQVAIWVKDRGGHKALTGKTVRLTTATALRHENPLEEACWQVIYDMTSDTPTVHI